MIVTDDNISNISYEVIICGSGPAGISLAIDLEKKGVKSLIIEAGDEFYNDISQKKYEGDVTGNFPKGHKCNEKCDMKKLYQFLS